MFRNCALCYKALGEEIRTMLTSQELYLQETIIMRRGKARDDTGKDDLLRARDAIVVLRRRMETIKPYKVFGVGLTISNINRLATIIASAFFSVLFRIIAEEKK